MITPPYEVIALVHDRAQVLLERGRVHDHRKLEALRPHRLLQVRRSFRCVPTTRCVERVLVLDNSHRGHPTNGCYAPLECVVVDDLVDGLVLNHNHVHLESIVHHLFGHQVAAGNVELLVVCVAGYLRDLHAVEQRCGNVVERVGCRDEKHSRQVERNVQVMVGECVVLFWVEHLEQRRGWIAVYTRAHLVYLVEQNHGIVDAWMMRPGMEPT